MKIEEIKNKLTKMLTRKRFEHSVNTMHTAVKLAEKYGDDVYKASIGGLLHDCAKNLEDSKIMEYAKKSGTVIDKYMMNHLGVLHGHAGSYLANTYYGIMDKSVLGAIKYHTTGKENMSLIEKVIYISDVIEPARTYSEVEKIRKLAFEDINRAMLYVLNFNIEALVRSNRPIMKDTIDARNFFILSKGAI